MGIYAKPQHIIQVTYLIAFSLAAGILKSMLDYKFILSSAPVMVSLIAMIFTIFIILLLAYKIWYGKNWARITLAVLFVVGVYPAILLISAEVERNILVALCSGVQILTQATVLVLLYMPSSNRWFKQVKAIKNA